jgi:hypothetical protein
MLVIRCLPLMASQSFGLVCVAFAMSFCFIGATATKPIETEDFINSRSESSVVNASMEDMAQVLVGLTLPKRRDAYMYISTTIKIALMEYNLTSDRGSAIQSEIVLLAAAPNQSQQGHYEWKSNPIVVCPG